MDKSLNLMDKKSKPIGIPDEWEVKELSDILEYEQPTKYLVENDEYIETGMPVLTPGKTFILGYTDEQEGIYTKLPVIIFDDFTTASKYVDFPFKVKSSAIKLLRTRSEKTNLRFIFGKMQTLQFPVGDHKRHYISEYQHVEMDVPPPPEQHAIAEVLSDVDALIAALDGLIAKKRAIKQGAMQELLTGKTRLPGFSGEWVEKKLGDVASFYKGKGLSKSEIDPYGSKPCIHYGELFTNYPESIRKVHSRTNLATGPFHSKANDVLMPTSDVTPNGLATASCILQDDVILGGDILVIRAPADQLNGTFLSYMIRLLKEQVLKFVTGTTVYHLYGSNMKNFTYSMPGIEQQKAIIEMLNDMDMEIKALEARRDKTIALKQGMMQELLTGKTRLI